jgi:hypothetical protein
MVKIRIDGSGFSWSARTKVGWLYVVPLRWYWRISRGEKYVQVQTPLFRFGFRSL